MDAAEQKSRWYRLSPDRLVIGLLAVECGLWLSKWLGWRHWDKGYAVLVALAAVGAFILVMLLWLLVATVFRRRFQFGIRALLVLTVAVALPFSWLGAEMKKAREQRKAVEAVEKLELGDRIEYEYEQPGSSSWPALPNGPVWLRKVLGDDFFNDVCCASLSSDIEVEQLEGLTKLELLSLDNSQVTDAGLARVAGMKVQRLSLRFTHITDAGLAHVGRLAELQYLSLKSTHITDAGLAHVAALTQLQCLDLYETRVTDAGLVHLVRLTQLQKLFLYNTRVTGEGVARLQRALPKCKIYH